jgi:hypothetical protein
MPVTRFKMQDGRVARFEVPDGTTPEQAQSMVSQYLARSQPTQNWRNDPIVSPPKRSKAAWENDPIISPAPKAQGNPFDQFDEVEANPFDQFDEAPTAKPAKVAATAQDLPKLTEAGRSKQVRQQDKNVLGGLIRGAGLLDHDPE